MFLPAVACEVGTGGASIQRALFAALIVQTGFRNLPAFARACGVSYQQVRGYSLGLLPNQPTARVGELFARTLNRTVAEVRDSIDAARELHSRLRAAEIEKWEARRHAEIEDRMWRGLGIDP